MKFRKIFKLLKTFEMFILIFQFGTWDLGSGGFVGVGVGSRGRGSRGVAVAVAVAVEVMVVDDGVVVDDVVHGLWTWDFDL
jgi:hypothetical protein